MRISSSSNVRAQRSRPRFRRFGLAVAVVLGTILVAGACRVAPPTEESSGTESNDPAPAEVPIGTLAPSSTSESASSVAEGVVQAGADREQVDFDAIPAGAIGPVGVLHRIPPDFRPYITTEAERDALVASPPGNQLEAALADVDFETEFVRFSRIWGCEVVAHWATPGPDGVDFDAQFSEVDCYGLFMYAFVLPRAGQSELGEFMFDEEPDVTYQGQIEPDFLRFVWSAPVDSATVVEAAPPGAIPAAALEPDVDPRFGAFFETLASDDLDSLTNQFKDEFVTRRVRDHIASLGASRDELSAALYRFEACHAISAWVVPGPEGLEFGYQVDENVLCDTLVEYTAVFILPRIGESPTGSYALTADQFND